MPAELHYNGRKSSARTVNLGSRGVYILTDEVLAVGGVVRLFIDWPAKLEGRCPLSLFIVGHVVRLDADGAAVRIEKYEFRLRPKKAALRAADPNKHDAQ